MPLLGIAVVTSNSMPSTTSEPRCYASAFSKSGGRIALAQSLALILLLGSPSSSFAVSAPPSQTSQSPSSPQPGQQLNNGRNAGGTSSTNNTGGTGSNNQTNGGPGTTSGAVNNQPRNGTSSIPNPAVGRQQPPSPVLLPQTDQMNTGEEPGSRGGGLGGALNGALDTITGARDTGTTGGVPTVAPGGTAPVLSGYLSVTDALNEALIRSPRAAAVRALLPIQRALYAAATVMPDPVLYRDEAAISEQVLRLGAQRTWDPPWKIAFRLMAAKKQVAEQKLELLNTLWSFRNDVRRAYSEVVIAQETYDALSMLSDLARRLLQVSEKLFKAGSVAELDVLKARLASEQAETEREQGAYRVQLAKRALNIIMGRGPDLTIDIPRLPQFRARAERTGLLPNLAKDVPPLNEFIEIGLSNRLELRVLKAQIAVSEAQLRNAYGNIIPDPQLVSGYSANNNGPSGPKIKATFFTMSYELPAFNFSQGDIPRLKATIRQYRAQILAQRNQITADVTTAYNHLVAARRKILIYQDHILSDSEKVARLARRSYEVGQSDITSTLAAQQANVQVRQNYLDTVNTYQQAFIELEQSVGTPLM